LASLTDSRSAFVSKDMLKPRANNRMNVDYKNLVMETLVLSPLLNKHLRILGTLYIRGE